MTQIRSYLEALMAVDDRPLPFPEGTLIFAEGSPGREMYIVRTGSVILKSGTRVLEEVAAGGTVGEMALIDPAPRSATAVAGPNCTVTAVTEHTFQDLVKRVPGLALEVMRLITRRLRKANEMQREEAPARPRAPRAAAKPKVKARKKPAARATRAPAKTKAKASRRR
jgi:CRP/FNR family transcriptional regulator, cyclic AMP receptor protein